MDYMEKYNKWLKDEYIDQDTKNELLAIKDNKKEIEERFYKDLEFGTGGMRGVVGAGSNRMNIYTIGATTQGLANYIRRQGPETKAKGVAIAYDSRNYSYDFAREAALVLNGNGIKTHLFNEITTTPELSFAVRYLGCAGGIVVTASHNPPEYNGFKVYSPKGVQLGLEDSERLIEEVQKIDDFSTIRKKAPDEAIKEGLFTIVSKEVKDGFIDRVKTQSVHGDIINKLASDFKIVYTPLHGTGLIPVERVLNEVGFKNILVVEEQAKPDGNFPTVKYPNPEEKTAFELALALAEREGAHIAIATDPDCDRLGVAYKNKEGDYTLLNGNQIGVLLAEYVLSSQREKGILPDNPAMITTIVTSDLGVEIAKSYGVEVFKTLTGFKFIGEVMEEFVDNNSHKFILGYEESHGYLIGDHARDKDGVGAAMVMAELAAYYYHQGKTLDEVLDDIYKKHGYYIERLESITLEGKAGMEKIERIMNYFRENSPSKWQGKAITYFEDYLAQKQYNKVRNVVKPLSLPKSNVLKFIFDDKSWFCIRPSGTEPKIKFYFSIIGNSMEDGKVKAEALINEVFGAVEGI